MDAADPPHEIAHWLRRPTGAAAAVGGVVVIGLLSWWLARPAPAPVRSIDAMDRAEVRLQTDDADSPGSVMVPVRAVLAAGDSASEVWVLDAGTVRPVPVVAGELDGVWIEVQGDITPGDSLVVP